MLPELLGIINLMAILIHVKRFEIMFMNKGLFKCRILIINFDVLSLGDNGPVITAIANDIGYENTFFMQMKGLINRKDIVIAISCSGDSPNIIKAVDYAQSIGCKIIGITGFDGGKLRELSDINFHVDAPKNEYGLVEDTHMIFDHIIYSYYNQK